MSVVLLLIFNDKNQKKQNCIEKDWLCNPYHNCKVLKGRGWWGGGGGGLNTYAYYTKQEIINGNSFGSTVETFNSRAMDELHQKQHSVNTVQGIPSQ